MDEYTEWDERIEALDNMNEAEAMEYAEDNYDYPVRYANAKKQRDDARFQIERAISMLETAATFKGDDKYDFAARLGDMDSRLNRVLLALHAWIEAEGGPWFQRG